ncbi:MAG TPA: adenylate/guanylate cyclase domain-containing protein [Acidimicrobiales bacterium]|jgi:adenylate cyclase
MRTRLTPKEFAAVRRRILYQGAALIAPVAIAISIYNGLWQPARGHDHLYEVLVNVAQAATITTVIVVGAEFVLRFWLGRHARWAVEGGKASEEDRMDLVRIPVRAALVILAVVIVFTVGLGVISLAVGYPIRSNLGVDADLLLSGFTYALIVYLQTERALRPLYALALTDSTVPDRRFVGVRPRLYITWLLGSVTPLVFIIAIPLRSNTGDQLPVLVPAIYMAILGIVLGLMTTLLAGRSVSEPIAQVRVGMLQVGAGDLESSVEVTNPGDLGQLQAGFNAMVTGLRQRREIEDLFGRHVGTEVARHALTAGIELGGETRTVTAFFVDIVGSTGFAESNPPAVVVARVNQMFQAVFEVVSQAGGWINKFEGDGCLCVFGAPSQLSDHSGAGLRAARLLGERLDTLGISIGIGVACGEVVAGNVGSVERFEYTVIGRPINEAARLTEAAKSDPTHVLATVQTVERANPEEAAHWHARDTLELRGVVGPVPVARPDTPTR